MQNILRLTAPQSSDAAVVGCRERARGRREAAAGPAISLHSSMDIIWRKASSQRAHKSQHTRVSAHTRVSTKVGTRTQDRRWFDVEVIVDGIKGSECKYFRFACLKCNDYCAYEVGLI
jgi:hypothetical protein